MQIILMLLAKVKPMLAELGSRADLGRAGWLYQPKLDGTRCICYKSRVVRFLNRRGKWFEQRYPEIVADMPRAIRAKSAILDGEIVVLDRAGKPDFWALAQREHISGRLRTELLSKQLPAVYYIFDIVSCDSRDLSQLPLRQRLRIIDKIVRETAHVKKIYSTPRGMELWKAIKRLGLEGVIAKRANSSYQSGRRSPDWLKIKTLKTLDVVVCGWTTGEGARAGTFGALLCGVWYKNKLVYIGRCGTGFNTRQLVEYTKILRKLSVGERPFDIFEEEPGIATKSQWTRPALVAEVSFMNLSKALKMRAPAFLRFRADKRPVDCTLTDRDLRKLMFK